MDGDQYSEQHDHDSTQPRRKGKPVYIFNSHIRNQKEELRLKLVQDSPKVRNSPTAPFRTHRLSMVQRIAAE